MQDEPSAPETGDRLRKAAKARGRAIRRRRRIWSVTAGATVVALGLGGGLVAATPSSHPGTHVYIAGQPPSPTDSATSTLATTTSGPTSPSATASSTTTSTPLEPYGSVSPQPPTTTTGPAPTACSSGQVSLSAQAGQLSYRWNDPISLTVTMSLVGTAPCLVDQAGGAGFHGAGCSPQFLMADSQPTVAGNTSGPWAVACQTAHFQPHILTTRSPDVVVLNGAINCQADIDQPCAPPNPGTRPWRVTVAWDWDAPADSPTYAEAHFVFNVEVTQSTQPTTTTTTSDTTTSPNVTTTTSSTRTTTGPKSP